MYIVKKIPEYYAARIYDLLIKFCEASYNYFDQKKFIETAMEGKLVEHKIFQNKEKIVKFFNCFDQWFVAYSFDKETEKISNSMRKANEELKELKNDYDKILSMSDVFRKTKKEKSRYKEIIDEDTDDSISKILENYINT